MAQNEQFHCQRQHQFLPLCDVLFNIISLASYFCDVVFDVTTAYALGHHPGVPPLLFPLSVGLVAAALLISQTVSLRWYLWGPRGRLTKRNNEDNANWNDNKKSSVCGVWCIVVLHLTQIGVLWRYFKLFIPVDLKYVKHEVRELCVLRLIHAFCQAAPMLLLQLYVLSIGIISTVEKPTKADIGRSDKLAKLTAVSAGLSLWSVCWAVASFSKGAARLRNLERLVLTWLGVLAQLAWRLGTVSARVGALVAYASLYGGQWLIVVIGLHWLSMLTWLLLTPDGLFHPRESLSFARKSFIAILLAFIYVFAYVNLHEKNHRLKIVIFYTVMFLENSLLIGVWAAGIKNDIDSPHRRPIIPILTLLALFFGGLIFMGLYYRFFHVTRLRYESGGRMNPTNLVTTLSNQDIIEEKQIDDDQRNNSVVNDIKKQLNCTDPMRKVKLTNGGIPGVFNCRFANPTVTNLNRKKKKPTTFVPPPPTSTTTTTISQQQPTIPILAETKPWASNANNTRQLIPFWKRPLSANVQLTDILATRGDFDNNNDDDDDNDDEDDAAVNNNDEDDNDNNNNSNNNNNQNDSDDNNENNDNDKDDDEEDDDDEDGDVWGEKKNEINVAVGSLNVNLIREKLREKKQQQLRELKAIQEEIKEGKLVPPPSASTSSYLPSSLSATKQQTPPNKKLHNSPNLPISKENGDPQTVTFTCWSPTKNHCFLPPPPSSPYNSTSHPVNIWKEHPRQVSRTPTPEILLAPRCLYTHWSPSGRSRLQTNGDVQEKSSKNACEQKVAANEVEDEEEEDEGEDEDEVVEVASDMEEGSQVSLPTSYTLPREFKYNNSNETTRVRDPSVNNLQTLRFYLPSTNSSDGDVDSADNEEETDSELHEQIQIGGYNSGDNKTAMNVMNVNGRSFPYDSGETINIQNSELNNSSSMLVGSMACYSTSNNSYGLIRPNQLQRANLKKHETKL